MSTEGEHPHVWMKRHVGHDRQEHVRRVLRINNQPRIVIKNYLEIKPYFTCFHRLHPYNELSPSQETRDAGRTDPCHASSDILRATSVPIRHKHVTPTLRDKR